MPARLLFLLITVSALPACSFKGMFTPLHLDQYAGDGAITKISFWRNPGVLLTLETFPLNAPYHASYRLEGLPRRPFIYTVNLVVLGVAQHKFTHQGIQIGVEGTLSFELKDGLGTTLFACRGSPEQLGWALNGSRAYRSPCPRLDAPREQEAHIRPDDFGTPPDVPATLEVSWQPTSTTPGLEGHIEVRSGGTL